MKKEKESIFKSFKFKLFLIIGITIIISASLTYGFFYTGHSQTGTSGMTTLTCFDTTFTDGDSINLTKALSMSDESGLKTDPYTFTITNNCNEPANYYVILNVKENSFSSDYINISLNGKTPKTLSSNDENTLFNIPEGYSKSYILDLGTLKQDTPITYDIRMWINASTTYEQVQDSTFEAQIKVVSVVKELDDTLYPKPTITLNFKKSGIQNQKLELSRGTTYSELPTPERTEEEIFYGWYTDEALTNKVNLSDEIPIEEDINLYARWETDVKGESSPTEPDGIPDIYQITVNFGCSNCTVTPEQIILTKRDSDGNPSDSDSAYAFLSAADYSLTPDEGYEYGSWVPDNPAAGYKITKSITFFHTAGSNYTPPDPPDLTDPTITPTPTP